MSIDDPRTYQRYEEDRIIVERRLEFEINIEKLQDDMRRVKQALSFDALAKLIPQIVIDYAPSFPDGGEISTQNLYDFLKLKSPSIPSPRRRLTYHAFMMVIDELYRKKWNYTDFVRRAGVTLTEFFATDRNADPYAHAYNLQYSAGLYEYQIDELSTAAVGKSGFVKRCLLLTSPKELPFLLAYDFDVLDNINTEESDGIGFTDRQLISLQQSWDLDARVGYYIPKRADEEGILLLNSYKWDWPTIYGAILNYITDGKIDNSDGVTTDILLTDVNSFQNVERAERSYLAADFEIPDDRKLMASRQPMAKELVKRFASLLERKFDWGSDL